MFEDKRASRYCERERLTRNILINDTLRRHKLKVLIKNSASSRGFDGRNLNLSLVLFELLTRKSLETKTAITKHFSEWKRLKTTMKSLLPSSNKLIFLFMLSHNTTSNNTYVKLHIRFQSRIRECCSVFSTLLWTKFLYEFPKRLWKSFYRTFYTSRLFRNFFPPFLYSVCRAPHFSRQWQMQLRNILICIFMKIQTHTKLW